MKSRPKTYAQAGVHINRATEWTRLIKSISKPHGSHRKHLHSGIGPFAAALTLPKQHSSNPILLSSCDGVGTKLKYPIEKPNQLEVLGQDLVAMSVNDIAACGGDPFIFLDYLACGALQPKKYKWILKGIQKALKLSNCLLVGGETAEMPLCYGKSDFDLAGFCVGFAHPKKIFRPHQTLKVGDIILGIPSNGVHSNGYSLLQQLYSSRELKAKRTQFYKPTALYAPLISKIIKTPYPPKGAAHITGGGIYENIPRALPIHLACEISRSSWKIPTLFRDIQKKGNISDVEMFKTFNMGLGFVLFIRPSHQTKALKLCRTYFKRTNVIGKVVARKKKALNLI
jgi:phosphoribosylformylglycinamidine cyclo-ligase